MGITEKEEIYLNYHDKVLRYMTSHLGNLDTAEDLTSDVFLKVYRALPEYDSSRASVSTWIFTISRNTLTDYFRRNRITDEIPEDMTSQDNIEEDIIKKENLEVLSDALKKLPEDLRDIIILHYYNDKTLVEIARLMCVSYGTIKIRHSKALELLRKSFA